MDLSHDSDMSYYKVIAVLSEPHQVFLIQHQKTKKIFVKKVLTVFNPEIYTRLREHPVEGVPRIITLIPENDSLTVIEEYVPGTSLREKIENRDLTSGDILRYIQDLCAILKKLHSQRPAVIHRDIKPSNVMITVYNRAVLLDFNAAKYFTPESDRDTVLLGTEGYAAPEQYGFGASSPQTDIYALGILLREMAAAVRSCGEGAGPAGGIRLEKAPGDCFGKTSGTAASFRKRMDAIIRKCTQLDPAERYGSVEELSRDLSALTDGRQDLRVSDRLKKYLLPGFRTGSPWKMAGASFGYLLMAWLSFTLKIAGTQGLALWVARVSAFAILMSIVLGSFNYLGIQQAVPLCRNKRRLVRVLGIVLLDAGISGMLFFLLVLVEVIFFPA